MATACCGQLGGLLPGALVDVGLGGIEDWLWTHRGDCVWPWTPSSRWWATAGRVGFGEVEGGFGALQLAAEAAGAPEPLSDW